jgi:prolyl oligopeptidase
MHTRSCAAAEFLIAEKYTSPKKLACQGGSNGGVLVGTVIQQRPDLFQAALPAVGVMDMLRYHKFTIGWAWATDYGTSEDNKEMFEYLYKYSPLHNAKSDKSYPAVLVTTSDHDDRVVPAHSFKFTAAMQESRKSGGLTPPDESPEQPIYIRIETKAGHGAGKPISKTIEESTDVWAFLMDKLGM